MHNKELPDSPGAALISAERIRQQEDEGWTEQHDDLHTRHELLDAAYTYLTYAIYSPYPCLDSSWSMDFWPWEETSFKPSDPIRNLVKAGALIAAEIDRLLRLQQPPSPDNPPWDHPEEAQKAWDDAA